jgi:transcriptional regulator with XRE-family HTH domain
MYTFPDLLKKIRAESQLTQSQLAKTLDVSTVLIAMVESGQKEVSKKLVLKLANAMGVHPSSITPFIFIDDEINKKNVSAFDRSIIGWGEKMQEILIKKRSKFLKRNAK